ncbi:MAG: hypothetical protein PHX80_04550 [Candidatus Nanoarchaeia archaeon]|nr:hypothetical protein [Candidatus Nanoarchaeia archaeon]
MQTDQKFELWCVVDLFGHQRLAGLVTEQTIAGAGFIRVDIPETKIQPKFTRLVNPSAIYDINPVTEEVAKIMAEEIQAKPIEVWDIEEVSKKIKALKEGKKDDDTESF